MAEGGSGFALAAASSCTAVDESRSVRRCRDRGRRDEKQVSCEQLGWSAR